MSRALTRHQHLSPERKYLLRRHLLRWAVDGAAYVPFIGDGDVAAGGTKPGALKHEEWGFPALYSTRMVYGADFDDERCAIARSRLPHSLIRVADCDGWPFDDVDTGPIAIADFDAWNEPWPSFRSFWEQAEKAERVVMFFTDAHKMGVMVEGVHIRPDGSKKEVENLAERRQIFNFYLSKHIWPWLEQHVRPYRVVDRGFYSRGMLTYFGVAVERGNRARRK